MEFDFAELNVHPNTFNFELAGYQQRDPAKLQFGINEMKLKLLWLKTPTADLVFVSLDVLYFPEFLAQVIYQYFSEYHDIAQQNIICNATHTHSAPSLSIPYFGKIDNDYVDSILVKVNAWMPQLGQSFKPCQLCFNEVENTAHNTMGRRRYVRDVFKLFLKKNVMLLPNKKQSIDNKIRILSIVGANDTVEAVIYNFSCHPVFATSALISSDFPGVINQNLNTGTVKFSLFLQGFCGDIRPNVTTRSPFSRSWKQNLRVLIYGHVFKKIEPQDLTRFTDKMTALVSNNLQGQLVSSTFNSHHFEFTFKSVTAQVSKQAVIKLFSMGNLVGVSIPAEVLSSYYDYIKSKFPDIDLLPLGFSDGMLGYLPLYSQIPELGYEVTSAKNYGWDSHLDSDNLKDFVSLLVENISQVLQQDKRIT